MRSARSSRGRRCSASAAGSRIPSCAGSTFVVTTWLWHVPALYELALRSRGWHQVEHTCFLATALLFWWPVIQPWPSPPVWPRWAMIPYLLLADVQNTIFSAFFASRSGALSDVRRGAAAVGHRRLDDQTAAGAIMWVPGSLAFLVPLRGSSLVFSAGNLSCSIVRRPSAPSTWCTAHSRAAAVATGYRDLLALPMTGRDPTLALFPPGGTGRRCSSCRRHRRSTGCSARRWRR